MKQPTLSKDTLYQEDVLIQNLFVVPAHVRFFQENFQITTTLVLFTLQFADLFLKRSADNQQYRSPIVFKHCFSISRNPRMYCTIIESCQKFENFLENSLVNTELILEKL